MDREKAAASFVPLSRGLDEHLFDFPPSALKVYIHILIRAQWGGPHKGTLSANFHDIGELLQMSFGQVRRAMAWLDQKYIQCERAKNQHGVTRIKVLKYKSVSDFAVRMDEHSNAHSDEHSSGTAAAQQRHSTDANPLEPWELQVPNNIKKYKKNKKEKKEHTPAHPDLKRTAKYLFETYTQFNGSLKPGWKDADWKALADMFRDNPALTFAEVKRRWDAFLASDDKFYTARRGHALAWFCGRFDAFAVGPQRASGFNWGSNGKQTLADKLRATDEAFPDEDVGQGDGSNVPAV